MADVLLIAIYGTDPPWKLPESEVEKVRAAAGRLEVFQASTGEEVRAKLPEAEVMFGFRLPVDLLALARNLKWVQGTSAGVDGSLYPQLVESDIILTSASGIHAVQISEHSLGMMIALARRFPLLALRQAKKEWYRELGSEDFAELYEKTLGIIGLGAIGEALAARAKAFGMRVVGLKKSPLGYRGAADEVVGTEALERVMHESDFIVNLLPLTAETRGLISAEKIAAMKPGAFFINCGRGKTVDEKALVSALADGRLAGAGLDVFEEEPLPRRSKLWKMENVIITPHLAGVTPRYWERATALFIKNLSRYLAGDELLNVVDKEIGY